MRLSRHAHYAIRAMLDLAQHPSTRSADIARRQRIPGTYIARVVYGLSRAGILRTYRGPNGGVRLVKPPSAVTLREVIAATEGPLAINLCVAWGDCPCSQPCPVRANPCPAPGQGGAQTRWYHCGGAGEQPPVGEADGIADATGEPHLRLVNLNCGG